MTSISHWAKMKNVFRLTLTLVLVGMFQLGFGQDVFSFAYTEEETVDVITEADIKGHYLGDDIAYKMQLLRESYTYVEPASATSPADKIIVEKQPIFFSIKKMDKFFKKSIKKGEMTREEAKAKLSYAIDVALNIRYQETDELEDLLWKVKDPSEIAKIYSDRVRLDI